MIEHPDHYFPRFAGNANNITVHVEAKHDVARTLAAIREAGCTAGLAFNPALHSRRLFHILTGSICSS